MKTNTPLIFRYARKAFTLIELLVVIAIIAILAAILFPVFARARENARRASCQSNLKQMGLGIIQYTQDYDEFLPNGQNWANQTFPYVKSTQIYSCPSDSYVSPVFPNVRPTCSYAMNGNFIFDFGTARPLSIAAFNATTLTVMVAEVTGWQLLRFADGRRVSGGRWAGATELHCGRRRLRYGSDGWPHCCEWIGTHHYQNDDGTAPFGRRQLSGCRWSCEVATRRKSQPRSERRRRQQRAGSGREQRVCRRN